MYDLAPIILFVYKRVDTLIKTVDSLAANRLANESVLYVFSDGYKNENDKKGVESVRNYIKDIQGFKKVEIFEADSNRGLANSIIFGVSKILKIHQKVIVLEDDLITTPNFLQFMNQNLNFYNDNKKVFSVSGYSLNICNGLTLKDDIYFFVRGASWGWASWADRWNKVDWKMTDYENFKNDFKAKRNFSKGGSDLNSLLRRQMNGEIDSWAIRWYYAQFKLQLLTIYPVLSKVLNNGFNNQSTHTYGSNKRYIPLIDTELKGNFNLPFEVSVNPEISKRFQKRMGILARIISKFETYILFLKRKS